MANIFDYLAWRADVPLAVDPFNEVDNLVLAEVAYTDFSGIVPDDGTEISLQDARRAFFSGHSRDEILASKSFTAKAPLLMDEMITGKRFRDTRLCFYTDEKDATQDVQLSALTCLLPNGQTYVAFRGTDGTIVGWKEDFNISFLPATEGQLRSVNYLNRVGRSLSGPLMVGGHSKGGNFAMYAASFCDSDVQDRIEKVYSNDGPGFRNSITDSEGYERILPRIISIVPDTSIIGLLMNSRATHRVIRSNAVGILQHDGFSWNVHRNHFEEAVFSKLGELMDKTISGWLEQLDDESRKSLTETVFSLFEATGKESFSSISNDKLKSAEAILNAARKLPKEKQQEVLSILKQLSLSGGQTAADYVLSRMSNLI